MFISEIKLIVRYAETDQMGIVHHSNYPIWFEAGRTDFIRKIGLPYSKIEEKGIFLPLIELKCRYLGSAGYEDEVLVKTSLKAISYSRVTFGYEAVKIGENKLITTGETIHVWTNKDMKPINIKKHMPELFDLLNGIK